ncbi:asparagine synthase-related protein [Nocardia sp. NPDC056541]|uniref:asparagine synthase-related protein n=1 Tax=Nocardia sp. NPDC056541 TaxID=3345860 RepID=UPI00366BD874
MEEYFIVLPDSEGLLETLTPLPLPKIRQRFNYPSGNAWIIGSWNPNWAVSAHGRESSIVMIGPSHVPQTTHIDKYVSDPTVHRLDTLAHEIHGSQYIIAWDGSSTHVHGSGSGMRKVFHTRVQGVPIAGSRADYLARLRGVELDEYQLALRLMDYVPHPLDVNPVWSGVNAVPPGHGVRIAGTREPSLRQWWSPPRAELGLEEGAARVRHALELAVRARTSTVDRISCDLSGGLDSTPITHLVSASTDRFTARTIASRDPADADMDWANRSASSLDNLDRVIVAPADLPLFYSGLLESVHRTDEPATTLLDPRRQFAGYEHLRAENRQVHLTGIGGDHLFTPPMTHVRDQLRRHPARAVRHLRAHRVQEKWTQAATLRSLTRRESYARWLERAAASVMAGHKSGTGSTPDVLGWDMFPHMPLWATDHARRMARSALSEAAENARPLHTGRGISADLYAIQFGTRTTRILHQMSEQSGIAMESPFFDDRVVEAALSVEPLLRASPWDFKTLIKEAMRPIIDPALLNRQTKGTGSSDKADGLTLHASTIIDTVVSSRLAERGLVDAHRIREILERNPTDIALVAGGLDNTLANTLWVEAVEGNRWRN